MTRRSLLAALVLAFAGLAAAPASTPTAEQIVDRYVAKRGGIDKLRALQSLRQKGRVLAPGRQAAVVRELKRPGKIRFEFTTQGVTSVYAVDGTTGWKVTPEAEGMTTTALDGDAIQEALEQVDVEGPLVDWKSKGSKLELAGTTPVNGSEAYKLKLTLKSGAVRYEYIDVKSASHVRSEMTRTVRGRPVQIETTFTGFKKTGGVLFPRELEFTASERPERTKVLVDEVEVNPQLPDSLFTAPAKR